MADGPVIQRSSERALKHGVGLSDVLAYVSEFRKTNQTTPVVLMGYANPIERMGMKLFAERAQSSRRRRRAGGGLSARRKPRTRWDHGCGRHRHHLSALADFVRQNASSWCADAARGYIYYVSFKGVTGAGNIDTAEVER